MFRRQWHQGGRCQEVRPRDYADGPPGHLQGHGCLLSGFYNQIENRADAHLPVPTVFELHRKAAGSPATDAWYVSAIGGFYRALIASEHADYGARFAGVVFPGETLKASVWKVGDSFLAVVTAPEREDAVALAGVELIPN